MIKRLIEKFYQTMFNYFVKKDGYSSITHYLASMMIMLICIFFVADAFAIANIIRPRFIGFSTAPKGKVFLVLVIMSILNYLFLFQILRLKKEGDQDKHLFLINEVQYKKTLKATWFIFISFFVLECFVLLRLFLEENGM